MAKMVQVFMVVRCCACETFQVHQVKKTNRWVCKMCGEKQSVLKVYGKGSAGDCRRHVQKLNMMKREMEEEEQERLIMENHPPEDYASTFHTESVTSLMLDHPVLVAGKESKWTTFTDPLEEESEEELDTVGVYTTDKNEFVQAHKKQRREVKRSCSDVHPLSKSARASLPIRASTNKGRGGETVYPYSSISREMEMLLDEHTVRLKSYKSCHTLASEKYHKHDKDAFIYEEELSHSMQDIRAPQLAMSHREQIARIREDIGRFTASENPPIPTTSSRWNKFMCESESESEEEESSKVSSSNHMPSSKSAVASYTLEQTESLESSN